MADQHGAHHMAMHMATQDNNNSSSNMDHMMMMKSYFHFGYEGQFFFKNYAVDNTVYMFATCAVICIMAIVFEYIKYIRCVRCGCPSGRNTCPSVTDGSGDCNSGPNVQLSRNPNCYVGHLRTRRHRLSQTLLHTLQTVIGLLIMLAAMSFNICIIFAIIVGEYRVFDSEKINLFLNFIIVL